MLEYIYIFAFVVKGKLSEWERLASPSEAELALFDSHDYYYSKKAISSGSHVPLFHDLSIDKKWRGSKSSPE